MLARPQDYTSAGSVSLSNSRAFRFALLFSLGMTEYMPVALLSTAMPVLLRRSGASMEQLGLLSWVMAPWAIKALWAPLVDKLGARSRLGRYRGWLFVTHPLLLLTLVAGAFVDVPSLLLGQQAVGIVSLLWLSIVSATADTASHGLAVNLLRPEERGVGNGVQTAGMMAGLFVGGGLIVMLVDKLGWRLPLLAMAAAVLLPLFALLLYREQPVDRAHVITLRAALRFFARPRIGRWLAVLAVLTLLPAIPGVPFQALFVDHGMSLSEIGLILGVMSSLFGALGGAVGGLAVKELGRGRAFYALNLLCIACLGVATVIVTRTAPSRILLYASVGCVYFGVSTADTVLRVLMMDRSRGYLASSDYTLQTSVQGLFGALGSGLGGILAGRFGAMPLFVLVPGLMLGGLWSLSRVLREADFSPHQPDADMTGE
jgi:MFS family permease